MHAGIAKSRDPRRYKGVAQRLARGLRWTCSLLRNVSKMRGPDTIAQMPYPRHAPRPKSLNHSLLNPAAAANLSFTTHRIHPGPFPPLLANCLSTKAVSFQLFQPATRQFPPPLHPLVPPPPSDHKTESSCESPCEATTQPRTLHITPPLQVRVDDLPLHFERIWSSSSCFGALDARQASMCRSTGRP
jgi:hypothetical protein